MRIRSALRAADVLSMPVRMLIIMISSRGGGWVVKGGGNSCRTARDGHAQPEHRATDKLGFELVFEVVLIHPEQFAFEIDGVPILALGNRGRVGGDSRPGLADAGGISGSDGL